MAALGTEVLASVRAVGDDAGCRVLQRRGRRKAALDTSLEDVQLGVHVRTLSSNAIKGCVEYTGAEAKAGPEILNRRRLGFRRGRCVPSGWLKPRERPGGLLCVRGGWGCCHLLPEAMQQMMDVGLDRGALTSRNRCH